MEQIFPYLILFLLLPVISLFFFCRYCRLPLSLPFRLLYLTLNAGLYLLEQRLILPGGFWLFPEACLMALCGSILFRESLRRLLPFSILTISILSVCQGWIQCIVFLIATKLSPHTSCLLKYLDFIQFLFIALIFSLLLFFVLKAFPPSVFTETHSFLTLLLIPIFFISLTERTISESVYGSVTVWDNQLGLIYPVVRHTQILFLQLFAGICLFALLFIWKKVTWSLLLEQQLHAQELYLEEVQSRYEKTRSFRHDVKNHLTVIRELLNKQAFSEASQYLSHLEQAAGALSYPVHTGSQAVDALLGSKLALAADHQIPTQCDLLLPDTGKISPMDWCILLSNALDNAIHANRLMLPEKRELQIQGRQKGNLYLISIENACPDTLCQLPKDGTGLSNIRAAAKKHGGSIRITPFANRFRLDILLVIS